MDRRTYGCFTGAEPHGFSLRAISVTQWHYGVDSGNSFNLGWVPTICEDINRPNSTTRLHSVTDCLHIYVLYDLHKRSAESSQS